MTEILPGLGLNTVSGKWTIRPEVGLERNFIPADDAD